MRTSANKKQHHIWIFNHYAITPDLPGGTRHYHIAYELGRNGYDVTIFAMNWEQSLIFQAKVAITIKIISNLRWLVSTWK